jgi:farnesyl-diphosphate farnesyltransferase
MTGTPTAGPQPAGHPACDEDRALLDGLLHGVSRTFALTIPQLPPRLARVVGNAYLLCRLEDTIEDEPALDAATKRALCLRFSAIVEGLDADGPSSINEARALSDELTPRLSQQTLPEEHRLVRELPRVIAELRRFTRAEQQAIATCVRCMGEGMVAYQQQASLAGLSDLADLDRYCYHVAGVVGEMLTVLFCEHASDIASARDQLMPLSVSFGQGLQMTNILKDLWEDRARGACWLPRRVFLDAGFDLERMGSGADTAQWRAGLEHLVAIAHGHLRRALDYTLLIPSGHTGIRNFCLWAVLMALLTLRRISARPHFTRGSEVKISRSSVRAVVMASRLGARHDALLRQLFRLTARGLPAPV